MFFVAIRQRAALFPLFLLVKERGMWEQKDKKHSSKTSSKIEMEIG